MPPADTTPTSTTNPSSSSSSSHLPRRPQPCLACKASKVRCDELKPACSRCVRRDLRSGASKGGNGSKSSPTLTSFPSSFSTSSSTTLSLAPARTTPAPNVTSCIYPSLSSPVSPNLLPPGRLRRPYSKSTSGCQACKVRRVKCGEEKPRCERCRARREKEGEEGEECVYAVQAQSPSHHKQRQRQQATKLPLSPHHFSTIAQAYSSSSTAEPYSPYSLYSPLPLTLPLTLPLSSSLPLSLASSPVSCSLSSSTARLSRVVPIPSKSERSESPPNLSEFGPSGTNTPDVPSTWKPGTHTMQSWQTTDSNEIGPSYTHSHSKSLEHSLNQGQGPSYHHDNSHGQVQGQSYDHDHNPDHGRKDRVRDRRRTKERGIKFGRDDQHAPFPLDVPMEMAEVPTTAIEITVSNTDTHINDEHVNSVSHKSKANRQDNCPRSSVSRGGFGFGPGSPAGSGLMSSSDDSTAAAMCGPELAIGSESGMMGCWNPVPNSTPNSMTSWNPLAMDINTVIAGPGPSSLAHYQSQHNQQQQGRQHQQQQRLRQQEEEFRQQQHFQQTLLQPERESPVYSYQNQTNFNGSTESPLVNQHGENLNLGINLNLSLGIHAYDSNRFVDLAAETKKQEEHMQMDEEHEKEDETNHHTELNATAQALNIPGLQDNSIKRGQNGNSTQTQIQTGQLSLPHTINAIIAGRRFDVNELQAFFPNSEQRQIFAHFLNETADVIVAAPTARHRNPWRHNFVKFAVGLPSGQDIVHDAFRLGLLSLASFDMGYKLSHYLSIEDDNAMYERSRQQRQKALDSLEIGRILGKFSRDLAAADLAIGTVISLAIRDRLAGAQDFEVPLKLAIDIVTNYGGPEIFIALDPTPTRRFLVEHLACIEMIGCLTTLEMPQLLTPTSMWLTGGHDILHDEDHLQVVYNLDRYLFQFLARSYELVDLKRQVEVLQKVLDSAPHVDVLKGYQEKHAEMLDTARSFLEETRMLKNMMLMTPVPRRVIIGNLIFHAVTELWILFEIFQVAGKSSQVTDTIAGILDLVEDALAQKIYNGLLMPLSLAAGYSFGDQRKRAMALLEALRPKSYLDHALTTRLVQFFWKIGDAQMVLTYHDWCTRLREAGCFAPIF